jgi:hypothetical protein
VPALNALHSASVSHTLRHSNKETTMTTVKEGMGWFKQNFAEAIKQGTAGTPFSLDMLTAVAVQETFSIWGKMFKTLPVAKVLELCVGDTLDAPNRSAFPKTKADLMAASKGDQMFAIARQALVALGPFDAIMHGVARNHPDKFCHGYGIFQYDIQFFPKDPDYFLQRKWVNFGDTLGKAVQELTAAQKRAHLAGKSSLTDMEMAAVAIAYNRGSFDPAKGLKQGFFDGHKFYGENFFDFLQLAKTVAAPAPAPAPVAAVSPAQPQVPAPALVAAAAPAASAPAAPG